MPQNQHTLIKNQTGQSMTQYLVLMFVMTLTSVAGFGQFSNQGQHQVAMVAGEIAGKSGNALSSSGTTNTGNQGNSPYAGAGTGSTTGNPTAPTGTANNNPVTNPTGSNTTPAVPSNPTPTTVANNPVTHPTGTGSSNQNDNQNNNGNQSGNTTDNSGGNATGQTGLGGTTTTTEPEPKPLCTKQGTNEETPELTDDKSTAKEEDKGIFGSLWK